MLGLERGLDASQPQKAAGDSTVPIVRFHYIPFCSLSFFFSASNQVLSLSSSLSVKKYGRSAEGPFHCRSISVCLQSRVNTHKHARSYRI